MASVQATGRPMYYWTGTDWIPIASVIGDTEVIQDVAADMFDHLDHSNITVSYDDANNKIVLSALGNVLSVNGASGNVVLSTDDINQGNTNLYFTDGRAITATASAIATASAQALYQANLYTDSVLPNASAAAVTQSNLFTTSLVNTASTASILTASAAGAASAISYTNLQISNLNTSDIEEGSNLYFTNQRAIDGTSSLITSASANALSQANTYSNSASAAAYASASANTLSQINSLTTTDIEEGANQYFTNQRVNAAATGLFVHANHTNLTAQFLNNQIVLSASGGGGGGASLLVSASAPLSPTEGDGWFESDTGTFYVFDGTYWVEVSTNVSINAESAQDAIAPLLNHGFHENITATYNDASNKIILSASAGGGVGNVISVNGQEGVIVLTTSNIAEGTNRYFTNQRAIDAASAVYLSDATASTKYLEQTNAASTYVTQSSANTLYAPKNSPAFTGVPQAPTAGTSTSTTQIATTAYVKNQAYLTTANASSTYLTQINADNIYQTKADGITGVNASAAFYAKTGGPISGNMSVSGSANVTGNVTIGGNLTVSGSSTIINAETIQLADNTIVLNSNVTGVPTENAGIEIERGDLNNVSIRWNESNDYWEYTTDGTIYRALGGGAVQYAPGDPSLTDPNILTGTVWVESDVTGSAINVNDYLTKVDASATYITQVGASATYLTQANASANYVDFTDTRLVKYGSSQPSSPATGTVWIDSTNITSPITKVYNGTTWIIASGADTGFHPFFTAGI